MIRNRFPIKEKPLPKPNYNHVPNGFEVKDLNEVIVTRDERMKEIEDHVARSHSPSLAVERYKFLLSEVKRLEAENAEFNIQNNWLDSEYKQIREHAFALQKENAELREKENALLFESEYQCKSIANLQSKLDRAVGTLKLIADGKCIAAVKLNQWKSSGELYARIDLAREALEVLRTANSLPKEALADLQEGK